MVVVGDEVLVTGAVRSVDSENALVVIGANGQHAIRVDASKVKVASYYAPIIALELSGDSAALGVTSLPLSIGGGDALTVDTIGIPVAESMTTGRLATSWLSSNAPGSWTLRLHKRTSTSAFTEVATFTVTTA